MKLYKYGKSSNYLVNSLVTKTFWLAVPYTLNDSQEGAFHLIEEEPSFISEIYNQNPFFKTRLNWVFRDIEDLIENCNSDKSFNEIVVGRYEIYRSLYGLTSLSESNNNSLMWAHYADESRGVCIEFEVDEALKNLFPVTYTNTLPSLSATDIIFNTKNSMIKILTTKAIDWSYEKEWRLIYNDIDQFRNEKKGGIVPIPFEISGIIFGHRIEETQFEKLQKITKELKISKYIAVPSNIKYAMDILDLKSLLTNPALYSLRRFAIN